MNRQRRSLAALAAGLLLLTSFYPGRTPVFAKPLPAVATAREASPDYTKRLSQRAVWKQFPVRVYFRQDDNYLESREAAAKEGFDRWNEATDDEVRYEVTDDPDRAQVVVRFDPKTGNGLTMTRYRGHTLMKAEISIGVEHGSASDMACIAAHEFGHALGISGHSDDRHDLMYPVHIEGTAWRITERDKNTLYALYPTLRKQEDH